MEVELGVVCRESKARVEEDTRKARKQSLPLNLQEQQSSASPFGFPTVQ